MTYLVSRLFYQSYLVLALLNIVKKMTSLEYFDQSEDWLMFANCLHRCSPSSFLLKLTSGYLVLKSLTTVTRIRLTLILVWIVLVLPGNGKGAEDCGILINRG